MGDALHVGPTEGARSDGTPCLIPVLDIALQATPLPGEGLPDAVEEPESSATPPDRSPPDRSPQSGSESDLCAAEQDAFITAWQEAYLLLERGEFGPATSRMEQLLRLKPDGERSRVQDLSEDGNTSSSNATDDILQEGAKTVPKLPPPPSDPLVLDTCHQQLASAYAAYGAAILDADIAEANVLALLGVGSSASASVAAANEQEQKRQDLLQRQQQLALDALNRAVAIHADCVAAHYSLGVLWGRRREFVRSVEAHSVALTIEPRLAASYCGIATANLELGDAVQAMEYFKHALRWDPNLEPACAGAAMALTAVGAAFVASGDHRLALKHYKLALRYNARYALAHYNMGVSFTALRKIDSAIAAYELAVHFDPVSATAWNNLGMLHREQHNLVRAVECCERSLRHDPDNVETLNNLGVTHTALGNTEKALSYLLDACRIGADAASARASSLDSKSSSLLLGRNTQDTRSTIDASISLPAKPGIRAPAFNNLGVLYRDLGMMKESIEAYNQCLQLEPQHRNASQNLLLSLNYLPMDSAGMRLMQQAHMHWGETVVQLLEKGGWQPYVHRPSGSLRGAEHEQKCLRIGYISADLCTHSVSYFVESVLRSHDPSRQRIAVYCYSLVAVPDDRTIYLSQLPGVHVFRNVVNLTAVECSSIIQADGIDILIELAGHTGGNALDVVAFQPAPIQISWIGYPNTTGLPSIQYRLTDSICDPIGTEQEYSETLVRMDLIGALPEIQGYESASAEDAISGEQNSARLTNTSARTRRSVHAASQTPKYGFLCYSPEPLPGQGGIGATTPPVRLPPCMRALSQTRCACPSSSNCPGRVITFGSFNNLAKTTDGVVAAWCRILKAVPHSCMILKCKPLGTKTGRARTVRMFEANGVSADRLHLIPLASGRYDHLETYAGVDIALDTFPYSGTTTTCEAAWMGVPTVMLTGRSHAHNVSAGLYACIDRSPIERDQDTSVLRAAAQGLAEQIASGAACGSDRNIVRRLDELMPATFSEHLVAATVDEYVRKAVDLAGDVARICALRVLLRPRMASSPLCDTAGFTKHFEENVLRKCWIAYCRGTSIHSVDSYVAQNQHGFLPRGSDSEDRADLASSPIASQVLEASIAERRCTDDVVPPADDVAEVR